MEKAGLNVRFLGGNVMAKGHLIVDSTIPFLGLDVVLQSSLSMSDIEYIGGGKKLRGDGLEISNYTVYKKYLPDNTDDNTSVRLAHDYLPTGDYLLIFYSIISGKHLRYDKQCLLRSGVHYTMLSAFFDNNLIVSEYRKYKISLL
jgi:hypothetical protein